MSVVAHWTATFRRKRAKKLSPVHGSHRTRTGDAPTTAPEGLERRERWRNGKRGARAQVRGSSLRGKRRAAEQRGVSRNETEEETRGAASAAPLDQGG